jgi:hypothetical protein
MDLELPGPREEDHGVAHHVGRAMGHILGTVTPFASFFTPSDEFCPKNAYIYDAIHGFAMGRPSTEKYTKQRSHEKIVRKNAAGVAPVAPLPPSISLPSPR